MAALKFKTRVVKDNSERWLLTYADLMNLLLILFILLYTMSRVDIGRYEQVATSMRAAFGEAATMSMIGSGGATNSLISLGENAPSGVIPSNLEEQQMEQVEKEVMDIIEKENLQGDVEVTMQERGVVISIKEKVLFRSGSADVDSQSLPTIEKIGKVLLAIPGKHIRVEGHTDSDPINTPRFPDNQELSTARANTVLRILVNNVGIDRTIISATGYGENRPRVPNTSEENKAQNRRVDIVILRDIYDTTEADISYFN